MKIIDIVENKQSSNNSGIVICAFPGTGKTTLYNNLTKNNNKKILDSDSSTFEKKIFRIII